MPLTASVLCVKGHRASGQAQDSDLIAPSPPNESEAPSSDYSKQTLHRRGPQESHIALPTPWWQHSKSKGPSPSSGPVSPFPKCCGEPQTKKADCVHPTRKWALKPPALPQSLCAPPVHTTRGHSQAWCTPGSPGGLLTTQTADPASCISHTQISGRAQEPAFLSPRVSLMLPASGPHFENPWAKWFRVEPPSTTGCALRGLTPPAHADLPPPHPLPSAPATCRISRIFSLVSITTMSSFSSNLLLSSGSGAPALAGKLGPPKTDCLRFSTMVDIMCPTPWMDRRTFLPVGRGAARGSQWVYGRGTWSTSVSVCCRAKPPCRGRANLGRLPGGGELSQICEKEGGLGKGEPCGEISENPPVEKSQELLQSTRDRGTMCGPH